MYTPFIEVEKSMGLVLVRKIYQNAFQGNYNNPNNDLALEYKNKPKAEKNLLGGNLHVMRFPQENKLLTQSYL